MVRKNNDQRLTEEVTPYTKSFVCGVIIGAIGAVIYYRRYVAEVEAELVDAVMVRNKIASKVKGE